MRISDWSSDVCSSDLAARIRNIPRAAASPETPAARSPARSFRAIRRKQLQRLGDIVLGHEPAVMPPRDLSRPVQDALEVPGDPAAGPPDALGERGFGEMVGLLHTHAEGPRADQSLRGLAPSGVASGSDRACTTLLLLVGRPQ